MPKYEVRVVRTYYMEEVVEVEAKDMTEAQSQALKTVEFDHKLYGGDDTVDYIVEIEDDV